MSGKATPDLVRRANATARTLAKFKGKRFDWASGRHCARLLHFHLKALGHRPEPVPPLRSLVGARAAMAARDCATMADIADRQGLVRIAPAMMLLGDAAYRASEDGLGGILICAGAHKLMGWFPQNEETEGRFCVMDMSFDQLETGWRL